MRLTADCAIVKRSAAVEIEFFRDGDKGRQVPQVVAHID
jgi:hypothetical protein